MPPSPANCPQEKCGPAMVHLQTSDLGGLNDLGGFRV